MNALEKTHSDVKYGSRVLTKGRWCMVAKGGERDAYRFESVRERIFRANL